jgi:hypothetical protein
MVSGEILGQMFELDQFAWAGPDRLEVAGQFVGLPDEPLEAPVLVLRGGERVHRLEALPDSIDGPPADGQPWRAAFAWREAPTAFDVAELAFGDDISIELPEPRQRRWRHHVLEVRRASADAPTERARLDAELLAVQAGLHEGLERVRGSAEQALRDLREAQDAIEARDAALEKLRGELDAAAAEIGTLHERVAELELAGGTADQLRAELETARRNAVDADTARAEAENAVAATRDEVERLEARLTSIRRALDD